MPWVTAANIGIQAVPKIWSAIKHGGDKGQSQKTETTTRQRYSVLDDWGAQQAQAQGAHQRWLRDPYGSGIDRLQSGPLSDFQTQFQNYIDSGADPSGFTYAQHGEQPTLIGGVTARPRTLQPDPGITAAPGDDIRQGYLDLLRNAMKDYQGGGGGFGFNIPNVSFSPAHAERAHASLINMMDKAYQEKPPSDVREDVYSRLKGGAAAAAANERRKIGDAARLSGVGPNEPWVQALMAKADRSAAKDSTQGLTDFFDAWVQAALGRRHGALTTNAQLGTGVNELNAQLGTNVSIANAQGRLNASTSNAQAGYWRGLLGAQSQGLRQDQLTNIQRAIEFLTQPHESGMTTETTGGYKPGSGDQLQEWMDLAKRILNGDFGRTGDGVPSSGTISPRNEA